MNKEIYEIKSYDQVKALTHPLRREIFNFLGDLIPRTSQQLSVELNVPRNKVHYHMQELVRVGLLVLRETKKKGNFEEKYYGPISNKVSFSLEMDELEKRQSRVELDQSILTQNQASYLIALQEFESNQTSIKPMLISLKKDLTLEQASQFKQELIDLLDKWYKLEGAEKLNSKLWEATITLFPNKP
jgi:DNA-binding transcriptional ArsR family regulator